MALRQIRTLGDPVLEKKCKEIKEVTPRIRQLVDDMIETMNEASGVGLAAPQVGVLRRVVVIDVGEGPVVMINPRIVEQDGEQTGSEGCLSVPDKAGQVTRPMHVKAVAQNLDMESFEIEGEELLARAICHELDHLDGVMYVTKVEGDLFDVASEEEEAEEEETPGEEEVAGADAGAREAAKDDREQA